jgi:hypothetical protein
MSATLAGRHCFKRGSEIKPERYILQIALKAEQGHIDMLVTTTQIVLDAAKA